MRWYCVAIVSLLAVEGCGNEESVGRKTLQESQTVFCMQRPGEPEKLESRYNACNYAVNSVQLWGKDSNAGTADPPPAGIVVVPVEDVCHVMCDCTYTEEVKPGDPYLKTDCVSDTYAYTDDLDNNGVADVDDVGGEPSLPAWLDCSPGRVADGFVVPGSACPPVKKTMSAGVVPKTSPSCEEQVAAMSEELEETCRTVCNYSVFTPSVYYYWCCVPDKE